MEHLRPVSRIAGYHFQMWELYLLPACHIYDHWTLTARSAKRKANRRMLFDEKIVSAINREN